MAVEKSQNGRPHQTLYLLPCFTGAYNTVYRVYVFDKRYPDELKRSVFAGYSVESGWYGQDQLINAHYDAKTKILSAFEKGRGLGDCGTIPEYTWIEYGWRMMSYRYWGKCDGTHMPEDWPVIYRFNKPRQLGAPGSFSAGSCPALESSQKDTWLQAQSSLDYESRRT